MSSAIHLWPGYTKKTGRGEGAPETKARVTQGVASGISELERLDRRIEFIEDRFEELEAELYSRPSLFGPHFLVVDFCISRPRARRRAARGSRHLG